MSFFQNFPWPFWRTLLTRPLSLIDTYAFDNMTPVMWAISFLIAVSYGSLNPLSSLGGFVLVCLAGWLGFMSMMFLAAMLTDFAAQLMNAKGHGRALFAWLVITMWPILLQVPLKLLELTSPKWTTGALSLLQTAILIWIMVLHVAVIRKLYHFSTLRSIFLYLLPLPFLTILWLASTLFLSTTFWYIFS